MIKPKYKELIRLFHFWCGRLGLKKPLIIRKDNRIDSTMAVFKEKGDIVCVFHSRRIGQKPLCSLLSDLFHEMGHIINDLDYDTHEQMVISEREAEKFSIKMMKKHYPKEYKKLLKRLTKLQSMKYWKRKDPLYYEAWKNIKDYKNTMRGD